MPKLHRGVSFLLAAGLFAACLLPALAASPSRKDFGQISQLVLNSFNLIHEKDMAGARAECEKARTISEKFSDPFIQATVEVCFGDVDDYENKPKSACQHFDAAIKLFKATPEKHPARRGVNNQLKTLQGKRFQLAC
jgi:hypothetical protein